MKAHAERFAHFGFYTFEKFFEECSGDFKLCKNSYVSSTQHVEVLDLKITDCTENKCCNDALNPFKTILLVFLQSLLCPFPLLIFFSVGNNKTFLKILLDCVCLLQTYL